ncbi:MAG: signal recognition particle-docking protein FtsY [Actinomycetota bacterium]
MSDFLVLILLVGVVFVAGLVVGLSVLVRRPSGRRVAPPNGQEDVLPGVGDDAEVPRDSIRRSIDDVDIAVGDTVLQPEVSAPDDPFDGSDAVASPVTELERPAPVRGRMSRLRARLARSNNTLGQGLLHLLSRDAMDEQTWDDVEEILLAADLGVGPTTELIENLRQQVRVDGIRDLQSVRALLRAELLALIDPQLDRTLTVDQLGRPGVVLVVGVNGTGKTTTVGKLARVFVAEDKDVILGAADTFRAAAADQLETWGAQVGVPTVRSDRDGADPAAIAFDAVRAASAAEADVVLIDTAGRLQNKAGLMDELGKVKRVIEKQSPVDEVLLVLDATTGQNGMRQAQVFADVVNVTGIVLTKLDGTAKGGIVIAVQRELGVPVKLVGLGEGPDDLAPFDPEEFVNALLA